MDFCIQLQAPAKINLHLEVLGTRPDGYHDLVSLFQAVDLCDEILIRSLKYHNALEITGDFDCPPEKTTIFHAVQCFREATGWREGLSIHAEKRIPAGAGLGGGSSDAATVLMALALLSGIDLPQETMAALAASTGSDVPFFLAGGAAFVAGRGEIIRPILPRTEYYVLLVYPGFGLSTAHAFADLDSAGERSRLPELDRESMQAMYHGQPELWKFGNSFIEPATRCHPVLQELMVFLRESGAFFASMSGSGSTLFGLYRQQEEALATAARLRDESSLFPEGQEACRRVVAVCSPLAPVSTLSYHGMISILDRKECRDYGNHRYSGQEGGG